MGVATMGERFFFELALPGCCWMVRTVEGVAGERPPGNACGALGVLLPPLSMLMCFALGVVS
jgi:hypothetical protein